MSNHTAQTNHHFVARAKKFSLIASIFVMLAGALSLTGWLLDIDGLKSVYGNITMKANAALSLLLAGGSLWLLDIDAEKTFLRRTGQVCAATITFIGALTLSEHIVGWNLGIDQLLFTEPAGALATTSPGRMGPLASSCFTLFGTALLLLYKRLYVSVAQLLSIAGGLLAALPILGYTYGAEELYGIARYTGIAFPTSVSLFLLSLGLLTTRADQGITSVVSSDRAGGLMARRLLITGIGVPFVLGWVRLYFQRTGYYDVGFGTALLVLALIIIFTLVIWQSAAKLNYTEQQHLAAEAAVREREEGSRQRAALIELSYEPIFVFDLEKGIVAWNKGCEQLYGYTKEEAVGRQSHELLNTEFTSTFEAYVEALLRDGYWSGELQHTTREGWSVIVESRQQVVDSQGQRLVLETNRDITDRKRADQALRESRAQLTNVIASAMDAIITIDSEQRVVIFNAAAEGMFGCTTQEAIGQPIDRFIPQRFRSAHREHVRGFGETQVTKRSMGALGALSGIRASGEEFPIEASISQVDAGGEKLYTVILRDVTERKRAEEEVEQLLVREHALRTQAEEANRLKDEFLATVSHELRTPLNSVLGWASMLRSGRLDETTFTRAVETIERNARSQAQLVEDLLDVSRIISGKLRLDVRPMELISVIKAAIDSVRPAAEAKTIQLQLVADPAADHITGDANRLQQVIWNLLTNGIKFTPAHGLVQIRLDRTDSSAQITVSDTGEGISREFLPYVFDRFQQADGTTTRKHGGLGLGLAIVRHLVEMHGGTIQAHSAGAGQGASFIVRIPLVAAYSTGPLRIEFPEPATQLSISTESPNLHGLRILAVDDERDTRDMLKGVLEQYGVEVITAASAREALDALLSWKPDLILCDIGMPEEDGYRLIEKIRKLEPEEGGNTPAIALTGYVRVEERMRALAAGFHMFVPKPIEANELASIIASLVGEVERSIRA